MSNPPPGGREVDTQSYEREKQELAEERRNFWRAIDSAEYKAAMKHIQEISDQELPKLWKKLGLTARV